MKTPQLIGIIAGIVVFTLTVTSVVILLIYSGTLKRFLHEMQEGPPLILDAAVQPAPVLSQIPELYDSLLEARDKLPLSPDIPLLQEKRVTVRRVKDEHIERVIQVSDGRAIFDESAYDPVRLWGWFLVDGRTEDPLPYQSPEAFRSMYIDAIPDASHAVIIDNELAVPIGMLSLVHNQPRFLTVRIDNIWLTPAYQRKRFGHEAIYLVLQWLFQVGYRRVTYECDVRDVIGRRFLERCGFRLEAVLRKHKVFRARNRDTASYVVLNSEWEELEVKLKKYLGIDLRPKMHKIAEIDKPEDA